MRLLWNGRPLEDLTRDELIEVVEQLLAEQPDDPANRLDILARIAELP